MVTNYCDRKIKLSKFKAKNKNFGFLVHGWVIINDSPPPRSKKNDMHVKGPIPSILVVHLTS